LEEIEMKGEPWDKYVLSKGMNISGLSKTLIDAIDSLNQVGPFRNTEYHFDETSLKDYLYAVCKNPDNRRKIIKKNGALSKTFVDTLKSGGSERFSFILNAIKDDPELKGLCDKIEKKMT
jgi:hypothetical protein